MSKTKVHALLPDQEATFLNLSGFLTPGNTQDLKFNCQVRFSREFLKSSLKAFISATSRIPIEKFELDLFEATEIFNQKLRGKRLGVYIIGEIHHLMKLVNGKDKPEGPIEQKLNGKIEKLLFTNYLITIQYEVICRLIQVFNGLLVKWNIARLGNYDYRYSGRVLNVKLLEMDSLNSQLITTEVLWISTKLHHPSLSQISSPFLLELSSILHNQLDAALNTFLMLNPKTIDTAYNIEKTLAFSSKDFLNFSQEALPEKNLSNFKHAELKLVKGLAKCFLSSDPRTDYAFKVLEDLELSYRSFEKALIASILKSSGKAEFIN